MAVKSTAWDCALRLLGRRSHGRAELETKLAVRDFEPEEIAQTMERLDQSGLLDDRRFAEELTNYLFQMRGYSKQRIARTLADRGVSASLIDQAIEQIDSEAEFQQAMNLAAKRAVQVSALPTQKIRQRLYGFLARRGYGSETCYRVINQVISDLDT